MKIQAYILAKLAARRAWRMNLEQFLAAIQLIDQGKTLKELSREMPELWMILGTLGEKCFDDLKRQFETDLAAGLKFTYPGHCDYPRSFLWLEDVPFFLQFHGLPVWNEKLGLAIVGTRDPSQNSVDWLETQLPRVKNRGIPYTVSGGARGIDSHVHRLSLWHRIPTVVVVPSGLLELYPRTLELLQQEIVAGGGAIVSEYESHQQMRKHHFQARNRLISALALCTLIIEAGRKSGTVLTARLTVEQGKPVLVVPTHPMDLRGGGGLDLLFDGALLTRDADDICMHYFNEPDWTRSTRSGPVGRRAPRSSAKTESQKSEKI